MKHMKDNERWMSANEIAQIFHVTTAYIYTLTREKRIPFIRLGKAIRFNYQDVINSLEAQNDK